MSTMNGRKPDPLPPPQDEVGPFDSGNILGLFTTVRGHVIVDPRLTDRSFRFLNYLALRDVPDKETKKRKGYCRVSRNTIARDLGWSHDTVDRHTANLERLGYLVVTRTHGGLGLANRYHVTDKFWEPNYNQPQPSGSSPGKNVELTSRKRAVTSRSRAVDEPQPSGRNSNKEKEEDLKVIPAPTAPEELEDDDWPEEDDSLEEDYDLVEDDGW